MDTETVGAKLTALRGGKSRAQVALEVGISETALQLYENDRRMPRDEVKLWLCSYYGENLEHLFFDRDVHVM